MMALTICQPYAMLICAQPDELKDGDTVKRVENRSWPTEYRGPLLIHAGKSKKWLRPGDEARYPDMLFGYVLGMAQLAACVPVRWKTDAEALSILPSKLHWVVKHPHSSGPYLWVLEDVVRFSVPVQARGQQGLFDLPGDWGEKRVYAAAQLPQARPRMIQLGE